MYPYLQLKTLAKMKRDSEITREKKEYKKLIELIKFTASEIEPKEINDEDAESILKDFNNSKRIKILI